MATQKSYLDTVLTVSGQSNLWLDAASDLEPIINNVEGINYTYVDSISSVECTSDKGERFLIVFGSVTMRGKLRMSISVKTYCSAIGADILAHTVVEPVSSAILTSMTIGKLICTMENAAIELCKVTPEKADPEGLTSLELGTFTLSMVLRLLIGKVYHNNFNHDWPNNKRIP